MITKLRAFGAFWYDFIIGDDWRVAVGVAAALAVTWGVTRSNTTTVWWIGALAVAVLLPLSIYRVTRRRS